MIRFAVDNAERRYCIEDKDLPKEVFCECCHEQLIAKRGSQMAWHFAHKPNSVCRALDYENEMSEWHKSWQDLFPDECQEIWSKDKSHRADVLLEDAKIVIEFQHSEFTGIHKDDCIIRTKYWNEQGYRAIWIFDISTPVRSKQFNGLICEGEDTTYICADYMQKVFGTSEIYQPSNAEIHLQYRDEIVTLIKRLRGGAFGFTIYKSIPSYLKKYMPKNETKDKVEGISTLLAEDSANFLKNREIEIKNDEEMKEIRETAGDSYYTTKMLYKIYGETYTSIEVVNKFGTRFRLYPSLEYRLGKECIRMGNCWTTKYSKDVKFSDEETFKFIRGFTS